MINLFNKLCPWCGQRLRIIELVALDINTPNQCKKCHKFFKSDGFFFVPMLASFLFPLLIVEIFELNRILGFFVILAPITFLLLAKPIRVDFKRNNEY